MAELSPIAKATVAAALALAISPLQAVAAQSGEPPQATQDQAPAFEVTSVKPGTSFAFRAARCVSLSLLVVAYSS